MEYTASKHGHTGVFRVSALRTIDCFLQMLDFIFKHIFIYIYITTIDLCLCVSASADVNSCEC